MIVFFVSVVAVFCTGGASSTLDEESSITITLCVGAVLLVTEVWL